MIHISNISINFFDSVFLQINTSKSTVTYAIDIYNITFLITSCVHMVVFTFMIRKAFQNVVSKSASSSQTLKQ